jgi:hypothetical protein
LEFVVLFVDFTRVRACFEDVLERPCPSPSEGVLAPTRCRELFIDTAPDGARCTNWTNCASRYCDGFGEDCAGTCAPAPVCPTCGAEQYCNVDACLDLPTAGQVCAPNLGCHSGAVCGVFSNVCYARPGLGERCLSIGVAMPDDIVICAEGLGCDRSTLTCVVPHTVAVGDACDQVSLCPAGSDCVLGVNRCMTRPAIGEPCRTPDHACAEGGLCNRHERCGVLAGPGCACDDTRTTCPQGFACVSGTCQWLGAVDVPCTTPSECYGEACVSGVCSVHTRGETCAGDICFDGPCISGVCVVTPAPTGPFCWNGVR